LDERKGQRLNEGWRRRAGCSISLVSAGRLCFDGTREKTNEAVNDPAASCGALTYEDKNERSKLRGIQPGRRGLINLKIIMKTKLPYLLIMLACLAGVHPVLAQTANMSPAPAGMALIPAGAFTMGDGLDGDKDAIPIRVTVSAFYMETNLVSYSQWRSVYIWAMRHGYGFNPNSEVGKRVALRTGLWA
jgi:formylglycine-generating enzyme required for sulfatase activity